MIARGIAFVAAVLLLGFGALATFDAPEAPDASIN